jgi:hypothetical protein
MNIFFLSFDPKTAAEHHCDKHVVKMILETAQLLYSSHWVTDSTRLPAGAYKLAHKNHPCSIWVRESIDNYMWLVRLGQALCQEYRFRYGDKTHKTEAHIEWLCQNPPAIPAKGFTTVRLAMPDEYKMEDPIDSYRMYYRENKLKIRGIVKYTKREKPEWL